MGKLPLFEMKVGDPSENDVAVDFVALVDEPAIQKNFVMFSEAKQFKFEITDNERRLITGPLMIADLPIYRRDEERGEYNVVFRKSEIEKIIKKFGKSSFFNNVNWMHDDSNRPGGIFLFESIFVDKSRGVNAPSCLEGISDGSWIGTYWVENNELWEEIKEGKALGFSVQGFFDMAMKKEPQVSDTERGLIALANLLSV